MKKNYLWYKSPAQAWTSALPLGNGRLSAMVYGDTLNTKIQLDESTYWSGCPSDNHNHKDSYNLLQKIRQSLLAKDYETADSLGKLFVAEKNQYGTNMPVGNLLLSFNAGIKNSHIQNHIRYLDLENGIAKTSFQIESTSFSREAFVSNPAQVIVIHLQADTPFSLSVEYTGICSNPRIHSLLNRDAFPILQTASPIPGKSRNFWRISGDARETLHSNGTCGVHLEGCLAAEFNGCYRYHSEASSISFENSTEITFFIDLETTMFLNSPLNTAVERSVNALCKGYDFLKEEHIQDVAPLFNRVSLSLGNEERNSIPTDERIKKMGEGEQDNDLCRLMLQYGRYLLIASSRQDSPLPTHMGGIWNDNIYNNLGCAQDLHIDMNLQMQYWAAAQCSLPECYTPYFRYLENILSPSGKKTAQEVYHANGWTAHVVSNPWGFTSLGWDYSWGVFSLGGAWCATLAWDYYEYTNDITWFTQHGFPLIEGAAAFAADYVFWDQHENCYMTGPSYSPENMFSIDGKSYFLSLSTTCDIILIREILSIYLKAQKLLSENTLSEAVYPIPRQTELPKRAAQILEKLPPYKIGKHGQLQEWFYDFDEPIPNHRHTSHLLGLYPFRQITPDTDASLCKAAEVTIKRRHEKFEITSWGMNMLTGYYARLKKAENAMDIISETFRRIVRPNMSAVMSDEGDETSMWCGTWELDGNTGLTSAMTEMLLQSFDETLLLLPALPKAWKNGELSGLSIKGGHHVSFSWHNGEVQYFELQPSQNGHLILIWNGKTQDIYFETGKKFILQL